MSCILNFMLLVDSEILYDNFFFFGSLTRKMETYNLRKRKIAGNVLFLVVDTICESYGSKRFDFQSTEQTCYFGWR